jgi:hypothetical protein
VKGVCIWLGLLVISSYGRRLKGQKRREGEREKERGREREREREKLNF